MNGGGKTGILTDTIPTQDKTMHPELRTLLDWIRHAASTLAQSDVYYGHGTDSPLDEAAALVLGALALPFGLSPAYFPAALTADEKTRLAGLLRKRIDERIPVPYLTGRTLYGGYEFYVDERVLIPRSPIAELIEKRLAPWWPEEARDPARILDLCTGSGCIGILAALHHPDAEIVLADIDGDALDVAQANVERYGLDDRTLIVQDDGLDAAEGEFDWILCNPPYVPETELDDIAEEFRHEPRHALISGADGMDFTRTLLHRAADYLSEDGILVLEVGMSWPLLEAAYPQVLFDWVGLERGGEGVLVISRDELIAWRDSGVF